MFKHRQVGQVFIGGKAVEVADDSRIDGFAQRTGSLVGGAARQPFKRRFELSLINVTDFPGWWIGAVDVNHSIIDALASLLQHKIGFGPLLSRTGTQFFHSGQIGRLSKEVSSA